MTIPNFVHIGETSSRRQPALDHAKVQALHNFYIFRRSDVSAKFHAWKRPQKINNNNSEKICQKL